LPASALLWEARPAWSTALGTRRRSPSARRVCAPAPLPEICDRIVAELGVATKRDDDVVLLCARLVPATL
jgi:hypothetical protein